MSPDLEVVQIRRGESFKAWPHGYPYHTVRWHFHPEYELHFVAATSGKCFVGDYIGDFQPGNLVLTGPNLPHNWVSSVQSDEIIPLRCPIIQFSELFIGNAIEVFPELSELEGLLEKSRRGVLFSDKIARSVDSLMEQIVDAQGARRVELFISIIARLCCDGSARVLGSAEYRPDPSGYMSVGINKALSYIRENLTEPFSESDLAAMS